MQYEKLLKKLYNLNRFSNFKYNLSNIKKLSEHFGNPEKNLKIIHITGTNGKGSTAYKLSQILEKNNKKTGLFISPHLTTFRERITINQNFIEKEYISEYLNSILPKIDQNQLQGSFFEILTILAYKYFSDKKTDIACIEVGIGGKLDCTNIIEENLLSIITSISFDHTDVLGHSLEEIAINKAGIVKRNCPCVVGPGVAQDWIIRNVCRDLDSRFFGVDGSGLDGYFEINKGIVRKAVEVLNLEHGMGLRICEDVLDRNLRGRMEQVSGDLLDRIFKKFGKTFFNLKIYTDVGHNREAIENVIRTIMGKERMEDKEKKFIFVYGTSKAKNSYSTLNFLKKYNSDVYLIQGNNYRSKDINILEEEAKEVDLSFNIIDKGNIKKTLEKLFDKNLDDTCIIIFGSFFIMEETREFLQYEDEKDFFFLNEMNSF